MEGEQTPSQPPAYQQHSYQQSYQQQQPVYVQPVYVQPVYVQPQTVYVQPQQHHDMTQPILQKDGMNFQPSTIAGDAGEYCCGTSTFGLRMDFKNRPYRDLPFMIVWLGAMVLWLILFVVFVSKSDDNDSSARRLYNCYYYYHGYNCNYNNDSSDDDGKSEIGSDFVGKIIASFVLVCVVGTLCGFLWLSLMFRWAKNILKFLIGLKLLFWGLLSMICIFVGLGLGSVGQPFLILGILLLVVFGFLCLYYWCVRRRLRLAAAMIRLGTKVVQIHKATIALQFITCFAMFAWWILWVVVWALYVVKYQYNGLVGFMMVIMGYWTLNVFANIAHVTTCGVTAVWWFNKEKMVDPTWQSFRYATTKGLGSICCGSLLVAIVQALRAAARNGARRGGMAACLCYILLTVLEWLARYFSVYAYVQVAIYGVTFWQAAKNTWQLLSSRGLDAIINDDLSNMVLAAGAFVGGILTFLISAFVTYLLFDNYEDSLRIAIAILMGVVGFYIGYFFTLEFMFAVYSAIKAIFVCWAEDPAALKQTHPLCYDLMATAWAKVQGQNYDTLSADYELD